jgi:hypothetical protein
MDHYEISSYAIWYGIYLFIFIVLVGGGTYLGLFLNSLPPYVPPGPIDPYITGFKTFGFILIILSIGIVYDIYTRWNTGPLLNLLLENQMFLSYMYVFIGYVLLYGIVQFLTLEPSITTNYEPFDGSSSISSTLQDVQRMTNNLRNALDTFNTANDDTCSVMKGIEAKFLDNATAPSGDQDPPPTKAEAKELRAKAMPRAEQQWKKETQDWSATHGQVGLVECFTEESLETLVHANNELRDLLASAPVQRVTAQIKQIKTSSQFAQTYIDKLVTQLQSPEGFDNPISEPTVEDTLAISKQLIASARDIITQIQSILSSVKELKTNYTMMNQKSNDPNSVQHLASSSKS